MDISGIVLSSIRWFGDKNIGSATAVELGWWIRGKTKWWIKESEKVALVCRVVEEVVKTKLPAGRERDDLLNYLKVFLPGKIDWRYSCCVPFLSVNEVAVFAFPVMDSDSDPQPVAEVPQSLLSILEPRERNLTISEARSFLTRRYLPPSPNEEDEIGFH
jgi:hypothetical protein